MVLAGADFARGEFPRRVAKWVRRNHVQTDEHSMLAPLVPNALGPRVPVGHARPRPRTQPRSVAR